MPSRQLTSSKKHIATYIFIIITITSSIIIIFGVIYFLYYLYYSLIQRSRTSPLDSSPIHSKLRRFSYKELNLATNSFSNDNFIGKGGSGTVSRGILKTGKLAAVKLLDSDSLESEQEFQNELRILGGLESESEFVVSLLGYCVDKKKRLVVYEYMPNKSLQELLFCDHFVLNWNRRFEIILDVSRGLEFLHSCSPSVIHRDIKPSNILLDSEFRAKISDFGLSRLKVESEFCVDMFSQDLTGVGVGVGEGEGEESTAIGTPVDEVDFSLALQASSSSTPGSRFGLGLGFMNEKGKGLLNGEFTSYDDELVSGDCKIGKKQWGKDWWWKQDGSGELSSKDYVREWIGSQISPSANPDWDDDKHSGKTELDHCGNKLKDSNEGKSCGEKQHRKMMDWWKDEHLDDISKKNVQKKVKRRFRFKLKIFKRKRKQKPDDDDNKSELSFQKNSKNNETYSGDMFSRELSSTTSMRGTLCYIAPEYGGCEYLIEKTDIYSFGVLILVIVSGRRPLHVLASPMKLEKANLISWCRQLAQGGDLLELVDQKLKNDYNKTQASLCVNLALACLQKMPELRPDIGDIVKILKGEMELPVTPFEFSPSPPSKLVGRSRSRKKNKINAE